jgi:hypothetical protein
MAEDFAIRNGAMTSAEAAIQLVRELEQILHTRGTLHLQVHREVHRNIRYKDFDWDVTFHGTPYGESSFRVVSITVNLHMREDAEDDVTSWHGAKARGVARAIAELWPNGVPTGISGKERDDAVREKMIGNGDSPPVNIARAVQRSLAASEEAHTPKK